MNILQRLCADNNIKLRHITEDFLADFEHDGFRNATGVAIRAGSEKYILVDSDADTWEGRFIVAHELAHHLLGHLRAPMGNCEMEANMLAAVMIGSMLVREAEKRTPPRVQPVKRPEAKAPMPKITVSVAHRGAACQVRRGER